MLEIGAGAGGRDVIDRKSFEVMKKRLLRSEKKAYAEDVLNHKYYGVSSDSNGKIEHRKGMKHIEKEIGKFCSGDINENNRGGAIFVFTISGKHYFEGKDKKKLTMAPILEMEKQGWKKLEVLYWKLHKPPRSMKARILHLNKWLKEKYEVVDK